MSSSEECIENRGPEETIFSSFTVFPHEKNARIPTAEFLDACNGVVTLIESLGKAFSAVKYDIIGNINKLRSKYDENHISYAYIEDMILAEKLQGHMIAREALQWLTRGLQFIVCFFESVLEDYEKGLKKDTMSSFLKTAYSNSLERYHGWMGTQLFNILCRFIPKRAELLYVLALKKADREDDVFKDMKIYTIQLNICVEVLTKFYDENQLEIYAHV